VSITLEPEQERFIQEQVARGRFKSAHDVLAHAFMLLEQKYQEDEAWIEDVRQKVDEARAEVARGDVLPLETVMAQLQDKFRRSNSVVSRITNSSTLGYPQGAPLQVNSVRFILVQDANRWTSIERRIEYLDKTRSISPTYV
jgi:antitoxin ParD1/3/4